MSNTLKKGDLFIKEVISRISGDDKAALAAKISRKAISAIEGQLASLKAKEVDDENAVEDAQENLNNALYPTEMFSNNKGYCERIVAAQENLEQAEEILQQTKDSILFFISILGKF